MQPEAEIVMGRRSIFVVLTGEFDRVDGWSEAREDLGLNRAGDAVEGVDLVGQDPKVRAGDEYPHAWRRVVLRFDDTDALTRASDHLYDQARDRSGYGDHDGAEKVQGIASALLSTYEVEQAAEEGSA